MLETARLLLRKFTPDDLNKLIELRADADVVRFIGGTNLQTPEFIRERLQFYIESHERFGYGFCALVWKQTGETIGWSGLLPVPETGDVEVGYGMKKDFWGKGIGFEAASAWLKYGFETVGLDSVVAFAQPENKNSWRIIQKCGMTYEKTGISHGLECVFYRITREEYFKLHPRENL